jgi:Family of unknown function (DUF5522)
MDQERLPAAPRLPLEPEDYYYEGPYLVFTAAYHLKRGSCCGSGCRHCPYGFAAPDAPAVPDEDASPAG